MNLTHLLATSRSLMGIRKKPGPYKMSQEHLLPKFAPAVKNEPTHASVDSGPRTSLAETPIQTPLAHAISKTGAANPAARTGEGAAKVSKRPFRMFNTLTDRLAGLFSRKRRRGLVGIRLTQPELSLAGIKVMRNDLRDSDSQAAKASKRTLSLSKESKQGTGVQPHLSGMVWNRLSARLLRQAAQEFNVVQKERGRLLSQAGHGDSGSRGS